MFTSFFFFTDTATTEIYTLSLHDALPIWVPRRQMSAMFRLAVSLNPGTKASNRQPCGSQPSSQPMGYLYRHILFHLRLRSEEHTSELQSQFHLVCRLLLEKKKKNQTKNKT